MSRAAKSEANGLVVTTQTSAAGRSLAITITEQGTGTLVQASWVLRWPRAGRDADDRMGIAIEAGRLGPAPLADPRADWTNR